MSDRPDDDRPEAGGAWWADRAEPPGDQPAWMPTQASAPPPTVPTPTVTPATMTTPRRSAAAPVLPPRRKRRFARFLAWTACVLSAVILAVSVGGYFVLNNFVDGIGRVDTDIAGGTKARGGKTFLLVGSDSRDGLSRAEQQRLRTGSGNYGKHSDTMILAHISYRNGGHATLVSLPRDSLVEVPEFTDAKGKVHPKHRSKLNAAYGLGGPKLAVATIQNATGVHIDHYIEINFTGFLKMVDAIGGVDVCITKAVAANLPDKDSGLDLPAGTSRVEGKQALAYVRARHIYPSQDLGRVQAQQKFIGAMIRQTLSAGTIANPVKVKRLFDALGNSLTADAKLKSGDLLNLAKSLKNFSPKKVTFATVPVEDANYRVSGLGSTVRWDVPAAQAMFTLINQDKPVDDSRDDKAVKPSQVTVQVLNGSGTAGLGSKTKRELEKSGFGSAGTAKTAPEPAERTTIRYSGEDGAAKALAKAVPNARFQKVDGLGDTVELIIGKDFTETVYLPPPAAPGKGPVTRSAADTSCT